ncbi:MAG: class I SAM-dependent methyltransferase [Halofilum sp. (in: g-proteobacteria)]|nr:class I SAM-dependent methyltransferase [Halofilum sp. (in: g-proteobacteria)]
MSETTLQLNAGLQRYLHEVSLREPAPCRRLREAAAARDDSHLISSPEQVQLLALVARLMGARRVLEVGTYVGYTPLWLALALGEDARCTCIDRDAETTALARAAWDDAGVAGRIELVRDDAATALHALLDDGDAATYDLAYIDADKESQVDYYELCLKLVRPGGLVAVDNTLWNARVVDAGDTSASTEAVRRFNAHVHGDERVDLSLVPIGDGMTLLRRIELAEG